MPSEMDTQNPQHQPRIRYIVLMAISVIAIGAVFYHRVESLSWLDAIYFSVITITTVGYGDITPHTAAGKVFTIFYVLIGIGIVGATVNFLVRRAAQKRFQTPSEMIKNHNNKKDKE